MIVCTKEGMNPSCATHSHDSPAGTPVKSAGSISRSVSERSTEAPHAKVRWGVCAGCPAPVSFLSVRPITGAPLQGTGRVPRLGHEESSWLNAATALAAILRWNRNHQPGCEPWLHKSQRDGPHAFAMLSWLKRGPPDVHTVCPGVPEAPPHGLVSSHRFPCRPSHVVKATLHAH